MTKPIPGNSSDTAWLGIHDLDDLVQISNPSCGYMQNCNISPDTMLADTSGTTLEASRYPSYIFNDTPGRTLTRGERAVELFEAAEDATDDDGLSWALDEKWIRTENWQRALRNAVQPDDHSPELKDVRRQHPRLRRLRDAGLGRRASLLPLARRASAARRTSTTRAVRDIWEAVEAGEPLVPEQTWLLALAVRDAVRAMKKDYGTTDIAYGDVFRVGRGGHSYPGRGGLLHDPPPRR